MRKPMRGPIRKRRRRQSGSGPHRQDRSGAARARDRRAADSISGDAGAARRARPRLPRDRRSHRRADRHRHVAACARPQSSDRHAGNGRTMTTPANADDCSSAGARLSRRRARSRSCDRDGAPPCRRSGACRRARPDRSAAQRDQRATAAGAGAGGSGDAVAEYIGGVRPEPARPSWQALAAAVVLAAVDHERQRPGSCSARCPAEASAELVVASHVRALMAPQPTDVARPIATPSSRGSTAASRRRRGSSISPTRAFRWSAAAST